MKKKLKTLLQTKRSLLALSLVGILLLTGCGKEKDDKEDYDAHAHYYVEINGACYVFRECEGYDGYVSNDTGSLKIYEGKAPTLINNDQLINSSMFTAVKVSSDIEEKSLRNFEANNDIKELEPVKTLVK